MDDELDKRRRRLSVNRAGEQPSGKLPQGRRPSVAGVELSGEGAFTSMEYDVVQSRKLSLSGCRTVTWAAFTVPGADPGRVAKTNQDSYCVHEQLIPGKLGFFGVFDGHGFHGQKVSQYIAEHLPKTLQESGAALAKGEFDEVALSTFNEVNTEIITKGSIDTEMSGSTCVTALLEKDTFTLFNVGDSRAILGSVDAISGAVRSANLCVEHKPDVATEAERIVSHGGRIQSFMHQGEAIGPKRVWIMEEDIPGLCMTRAFGDKLARTVGVTSDPEVTSRRLTAEDKYLVLCSDGITEFITDDELVKMIHAGVVEESGDYTPQQACEEIMQEARKRWKEEEDQVIDDCTILVLFIA
mmetsp:Transcript_26628/g.87303  ORF Transcript_26628/g.87303 Transcript_26628/m.87303 type:complete len:355 (+) Transcript_26628:109-1173(+)|eukprot:CAMPEP_0170133760 /NCGR_PEP_ID=MMETSP0033_2-20121228/1522_1 /TAXON_ID=195969 /ORGANISM="Dolichomastix tenuilepis, Strain CCMP3274" /LENGTH=354 /DNA_ID=CAMNT_0010369285 /DNA_START=115 /DNA_END=1179 /DNA_ORIENTATION=+